MTVQENIQSLSHRKALLLMSVIPVLLALLVYSGSLDNGILTNWDDQVNITNNDKIQELSLENLKRIFTERQIAHYSPLKLLSFAIVYAVSGNNPAGFHLLSLIIHLCNIILVLFFIYRLSADYSSAFIAAALFAVHPMSTSSVAWISALSTLQVTFFYILGLIIYLKYIDKSRPAGHYIIILVVFIFALLSKSLAVTFPVSMILLDLYRSGTISLRSLIDKVPFFLLSLVFGIIAIKLASVQGSFNPVIEMRYSVTDRVLLFFYTLFFYLFKFVFPFGLSAVHYLPLKTGGSLPLVYYIAPVFVIAIAATPFIFKKHRKRLLFGLIFLLIAIFPGLQLKPVGFVLVTERYTYLPYIGLYFIAAVFITDLIFGNTSVSVKIKPYIITGTVTFVLFFIVLARQRTYVWKDGATLFSDVIRRYPERGLGYAYRAYDYECHGKYGLALADYNEAIRLGYIAPNVYAKRAGIMYGFSPYKENVEKIDEMILAEPLSGKLYYNRGTLKANETFMDYYGAIYDFNKA
ncbi:MAG: glycosyltransferase family 39 protein, partial [Bacteroidetes bacterium]|nr:glycosyltransferase family 39 protein [Bacteroidota bacterium]